MTDGPDHLLQIVVTERAEETVVALKGELDLSGVPELGEVLASLDAPRAVVVDLSELSFLDSSGLGALVTANRDDRPVRLRAPSPAVRRVLEVSGVDQLLANDGD